MSEATEKIRQIFRKHYFSKALEVTLKEVEKEVLAAVESMEQQITAKEFARKEAIRDRQKVELRLSEIREPDFLEKLAALGHEQLAHWVTHEDDITKQGLESWKRWLKQAQTPYEQLSNEEKEYDREWARKVLKLLDRGEHQ